MREVDIVGSGPAGSSAALAALAAGANVRIFDKSRLPRHKVCGEFISPEIAPLLERLGVDGAFLAARPATIRRMAIHLGRSRSTSRLPETGWGLSRFRLDELLLAAAVRNGASLRRNAVEAPKAGQIWAVGRAHSAVRGGRLFGFKAHYEGPQDDAVELFFFGGCYVGVSSIEEGLTNVCGIAPEETLRTCGFEAEALLQAHAPLADRLRPLTRRMTWLTTGPLAFENRFVSGTDVYLAGDALSFVDPFTGSGLLNAVLSGSRAGECAAAGTSVHDYLGLCRTAMEKPFRCAGWLRGLAGTRFAELALPWIPGQLLFRFTRPRSAA